MGTGLTDPVILPFAIAAQEKAPVPAPLLASAHGSLRSGVSRPVRFPSDGFCWAHSFFAASSRSRIEVFPWGSSRRPLYRRGSIKQLSRDQSLVQLLYEEGSITAAEKKSHVHRNIIFPVMGNMKSKPKPDIKNHKEIMKYGDVILICSDGLSDYVSCSDMEQILERPTNLTNRLQRLVKLAIDKGSKDNITILALCCYE